ncbi:Tetracycline resistance MFS efflux pump [Planctomycetales bacterium 10988]|nr:Tetracycline resistance MFS efflux pump [Planctomycetales bacterium 10988]
MTSESPSSLNSPAVSHLSRKMALLVIFLTVFIDLIGFGMVLPLLPLYAEQFGTDESGLVLGLLMSSFSAMQFLFAPWWGRLSDRIGRRPVLMIGLAGSVIFYGLFGIATVWGSLPLLFISRIGAGMAGATISTAQAYISDVTSNEQRTRGMALIGAAFGLGFTLGPMFAYFALWGKADQPGAGPGYVASGLSLVALVLAYFYLPESRQLRPAGKTSQRESVAKGLRISLAIPSVALLILVTFFGVLAFAGFESTLSLLLHLSRENNLQETCLIFAFIGLVGTISQGVLVRTLARFVPDSLLAIGGTLCQALSFFMLSQSGPGSPPAFLFAGLTLLAVGFSFFNTSMNALISRRSDPNRQGIVLGFLQSSTALARILGPILGLLIFKQLSPTTPMLASGLLMIFVFFLVLLALRQGEDFVPFVQEKASS